MDTYNFYTKVLNEAYVNYLPVEPDLESPLDELKEPLDAIVRVRIRLLENVMHQTL